MIENVHHIIYQEGFKSEIDEEHITTLVVSETDHYAGNTEILSLSRNRLIFDTEMK